MKRYSTIILILYGFIIHSLSCASQNNTPLIGAYYFDGWSGHRKDTASWAKDAPTHLTYKLYNKYKDRMPLWGWRDDTQDIIDKQISLASKNGIDFFSFCWYWSNDKGDIDTLKIINNPLHTGLHLFMNSKKKKKMKFSLMVANHAGFRIESKENWIKALDFWIKHYFNDSQYLLVDGKPVITIFSYNEEIDKFIPDLRRYIKENSKFEDLYIISCWKKYPNSDMLSWYNIREKEPGYSSAREYDVLCKNTCKTWEWASSKYQIAPCVMVNWDRRPWEKDVEGIYYQNRTPILFKNQVKEALSFLSIKRMDNNLIFIYSWNELGEGGYLVPTIGDPKGEYLKAIKLARTEFLKEQK